DALAGDVVTTAIELRLQQFVVALAVLDQQYSQGLPRALGLHSHRILIGLGATLLQRVFVLQPAGTPAQIRLRIRARGRRRDPRRRRGCSRARQPATGWSAMPR